jgi:DMSO/TMAO reductase YedYZ heme-binding membrane subunit
MARKAVLSRAFKKLGTLKWKVVQQYSYALSGLGMVALGIGMIYLPAGVIAGGLALLIMEWRVSDDE